MTAEDDIRAAWQNVGNGAPPPAAILLRGSAARFERRIRTRGALEHAAGALVIAVFAAFGATTPSRLVALASAVIVAGALVVLWQLQRRGSLRPLPDACGATSLIAHHRAQLVRQHTALKSIALWYLAPLAPGLGLFLYATTPPGQPLVAAIKFSSAAAVFAAAWWVNRRGATDLAEQIAELDALRCSDD